MFFCNVTCALDEYIASNFLQFVVATIHKRSDKVPQKQGHSNFVS